MSCKLQKEKSLALALTGLSSRQKKAHQLLTHEPVYQAGHLGTTSRLTRSRCIISLGSEENTSTFLSG